MTGPSEAPVADEATIVPPQTTVPNAVVPATSPAVAPATQPATPHTASFTLAEPMRLPATPIVKRQTYSSVMSYVGITRRTTAWVRRVGTTTATLAVAIAAAVAFLLIMYAFVTVWYIVVGFLFGWLLFPFRLVRRSHRKQEALQQQQLATMQAMLIEQQQENRV